MRGRGGDFLHAAQRQREGVAHGLLAHGGAVAGEVARFSAFRAIGTAPAKADGADGLGSAASRRASDAGG